MQKTVILASQSPRRKMLLEKIGIRAEIIPSVLPEVITETDPERAVRALSLQKAADIAAQCRKKRREAVVIGADTVVAADGRILGKPATHEEAAEMIRMLSGREHAVYTGVTIIHTGGSGEDTVRTFAEKTIVSVYPMSEEEIQEYAASMEPMDKAGAYGIQGSFARYIRRICGDYNNVVGLPAAAVYQELKSAGYIGSGAGIRQE